MADHLIKCWPQQFWAIRSGLKTFEYRKNDRGYRVGDTLVIREYDPATEAFSGAEARRRVTHMLASGFGLPEGYAVLGLGDESAPGSTDRLIVTEGPWQWWAGRSEEWFDVGPEGTKAAIIKAATNDSLGENDDDGSWKLSFHIVEARQDPLRIADWLDLDALIERAEDNVADSDRVASENDDGPWFECSPEQEKDLRQRVARACDEWQAAHGLAFKTATFSHTRNSEHVVVDLAINALAAPSEGDRDA